MNKNTAKDYLPLVQALAEGKVIQGLIVAIGKWEDMREVNFASPSYQYRIKPEPLVIYVAMNAHQTSAYITSRNRLAVSDAVATSNYTDGKVRKFVEVIED